jgi:hypothetical protein
MANSENSETDFFGLPGVGVETRSVVLAQEEQSPASGFS